MRTSMVIYREIDRAKESLEDMYQQKNLEKVVYLKGWISALEWTLQETKE